MSGVPSARRQHRTRPTFSIEPTNAQLTTIAGWENHALALTRPDIGCHRLGQVMTSPRRRPNNGNGTSKSIACLGPGSRSTNEFRLFLQSRRFPPPRCALGQEEEGDLSHSGQGQCSGRLSGPGAAAGHHRYTSPGGGGPPDGRRGTIITLFPRSCKQHRFYCT